MAQIAVTKLLSCAALNCTGANVRGKIREYSRCPLGPVLANHPGDHFTQHRGNQCKIRNAGGFETRNCVAHAGLRFVKTRRDAAVIDLVRAGKHLDAQIMKRFSAHAPPSRVLNVML